MYSQRPHQRAKLASELLAKNAPGEAPVGERVPAKLAGERLFYKKGAASTAPFRPVSWTYADEGAPQMPPDTHQRRRRSRPRSEEA